MKTGLPQQALAMLTAAALLAFAPGGVYPAPRECDTGSIKLSFGVSFSEWEKDGADQRGAEADFTFENTRLNVAVLSSTGKASDIAASLYDMLEMPLIQGERYRLCFTAHSTRECTVIAKFDRIISGGEGSLQDPAACTFRLEAGTGDCACEFTALETTESERFTILFGRAAAPTVITISDMKLHILVTQAP